MPKYPISHAGVAAFRQLAQEMETTLHDIEARGYRLLNEIKGLEGLGVYRPLIEEDAASLLQEATNAQAPIEVLIFKVHEVANRIEQLLPDPPPDDDDGTPPPVLKKTLKP